MADAPDTPAVQESIESGIVQGRQYRYTIDGLGVQLDRYVGGVCSTLMVRSSTIGLVGALRIAKLCSAHHEDGATWENVTDLRDELINLVTNGSRPLPTPGNPRSPPQSNSCQFSHTEMEAEVEASAAGGGGRGSCS